MNRLVYGAKTGRKVQMFMDAFHAVDHALDTPEFDPFRYWAAASATLRREAYEAKS